MAEVGRIIRFRQIESYLDHPPAPEVVYDQYPKDTGIYNLQGGVVFQEEFRNNTKRIQLIPSEIGLEKGVYVISIADDNYSYSDKLVVL